MKWLFDLKNKKNQNGQVAIFVALIFQVIFIFFAILINVGLLVHHKINLQNSVDIAAYYGAMKQAEQLNMISNLNFNIRQAWKLFAWRFRALGGYGLANEQGVIGGCPGFAETPAFCVSHYKHGLWGRPATTENFCQIACGALSGGIGKQLASLRGNSGNIVGSSNSAIALNNLANKVNEKLKADCEESTVKNKAELDNIVGRYNAVQSANSVEINKVKSNLSQNKDNFKDLNNDKVIDGVRNTLINNLTEANRSTLGNSIQYFNSLSDESVRGGCTANEMLGTISFPASLPRMTCVAQNAGVSGNPPVQMYTLLFSVVIDVQNFSYTVFKNDSCQAYYGVRASAEPKIPFLPLKTVKIHAFAFAKPFGGQIGPPEGAESAIVRGDLPNFSFQVGDSGGLDAGIIRGYHGSLNGVGSSGPNSTPNGGAGENNAMAVNQFDVTYFSIDHRFSSNYTNRIGVATSRFGHMLGGADKGPVTNKGQLLTGWTYLNSTNASGYTTFPSNGSMQFGHCDDGGTINAPGDCNTGGRVGYSVKIVSPDVINSSGNRNQIPREFLDFTR